MRNVRSLLLCGVASLISAGCAIRPVPEDVTRKNTFAIVQTVRCEARAAITTALADELGRYPSSKGLAQEIVTGKLRVEEFATLYDAGTYARVIFGDAEGRIDTYRHSAIGFDFEFDIKENNNDKITANIVNIISLGTVDLGISVGDERFRQNKRTFRVASYFGDLLTDKELVRICVYPYRPRSDWIYPITGTIGLEETVATFLDIAVLGGLDPENNKFTDVITFQTKYFGQIDPKLTISPVTGDFNLKDISGQAKPDRIDKHQVTVAIALDKKKIPPKIRQRPSARLSEGPLGDAKAEVNRILDDEKFLGFEERIIERIEELEQ